MELRFTLVGCDIREEAQIEGCNAAIALASPFGKDEALRTLPPDDRGQDREDEKRQARRECIDKQSMDTRKRGDIRVCKQDSRPKG